jgi:predicted MarR family transcription regulator
MLSSCTTAASPCEGIGGAHWMQTNTVSCTHAHAWPLLTALSAFSAWIVRCYDVYVS